MKHALPALLSAALLCASGTASSSTPAATTTPLDDLSAFCIEAQQIIAGTRLPVQSVRHTDYDAFVLSKPEAQPLRTEQYVWYVDAARTQPKMISCKMKTSDHIATVYGADQTRGEGMCADINRATLQRVLASVPAGERRRLAFDGGTRVVFDIEEVTTNGPEWLAPYAFAYRGGDGALHLRAKAMRNDWLDPRLAGSPARFKGTRYCHLIAPSYLAGILRGEVTP